MTVKAVSNTELDVSKFPAGELAPRVKDHIAAFVGPEINKSSLAIVEACRNASGYYNRRSYDFDTIMTLFRRGFRLIDAHLRYRLQAADPSSTADPKFSLPTVERCRRVAQFVATELPKRPRTESIFPLDTITVIRVGSRVFAEIATKSLDAGGTKRVYYALGLWSEKNQAEKTLVPRLFTTSRGKADTQFRLEALEREVAINYRLRNEDFVAKALFARAFNIQPNQREFLFIHEFCNSLTVSDRSAEILNHPLSNKAALMDHILASAHRLHGLGIVHRDLHLDNIMLHKTPEQQWTTPKMIDFGLARQLTHPQGDLVPMAPSPPPANHPNPNNYCFPYETPQQTRTRELSGNQRVAVDTPVCPADDIWRLGIEFQQKFFGIALPLEGHTLQERLAYMKAEKKRWKQNPPLTVEECLASSSSQEILEALFRRMMAINHEDRITPYDAVGLARRIYEIEIAREQAAGQPSPSTDKKDSKKP